jgi:hypothetical protein
MKINESIKLFMVMVWACFTLSAIALAQEIPKPGTVIDKNNCKQYAHLFPAEFLKAFEDGFGGLMEPASITIGETNKMPSTFPEAFLALSAKNKGKFSIDANGKLIGGWQREGFPFPDLEKSDKDFITKLMWNYAGRYVADDQAFESLSYIQRKGEPVRSNVARITWLYFTNRAFVPPVPRMSSENNLAYAMHLFYVSPENLKNMQTLALRYMDAENKADETYLYLPNLRRVLRGDSGQRAVPLQGNLSALDDFNVFDGKTDDFTYTLVGEQKVLNPPRESSQIPKKLEKIGIPSEGWVPEDVYVIDIVAKDPVYPQSKKRVWMDKERLMMYYAVAWDRAGKLWKLWHIPGKWYVKGDTRIFLAPPEGFVVDMQFGMTNAMTCSELAINAGDKSWDNMSPAAMVKKAR